MIAHNTTTFYDILITFIKYGLPVVCTLGGSLGGIFIGKWIEERKENKKMKEEIYLEANRALSRYKDIYLTTPLNMSENNASRLHEQQMLLENAKSDLEIFGTDEAIKTYSECLSFIVKAANEVLNRKQIGEMSTNIASNIKEVPSYKKFLGFWPKWNNIVRKDLRIKI